MIFFCFNTHVHCLFPIVYQLILISCTILPWRDELQYILNSLNVGDI